MIDEGFVLSMQRHFGGYFVLLASWFFLLQAALMGAGTLNGVVVDESGAPVSEAHVFAEPGLGGELLVAKVSEEGRFFFEDFLPGPVGVFAVAEGFGFSGRHLNIPVGEDLPGMTITLYPEETISGRVVDPKGKAVEGARITRMALLAPDKVGIPLAKLDAAGYQEPSTGRDGRFRMGHLPRGAKVALKVGHPDFAQEGVDDLAAGSRNVRIEMHPGVLIQGSVQTREEGGPVPQAAIIIKSAHPPHDTAIARSDAAGSFAIRLKPGVYLCQASAAGQRSAGWEQLLISGEQPWQRVRLSVAGAGSIRGSIKDAVSGTPLSQVRVMIFTEGTLSAMVRTGATGEFHATVGEGESIVWIESPTGYQKPQTPAVGVPVAAGEEVELPGFWLAPETNP